MAPRRAPSGAADDLDRPDESLPLLLPAAARRNDGGLQCSYESGATKTDTDTETLLSRCTVGLLAQFAGVGVLSGALPGLLYPILQGYLNADGATVVSATLLVQLPWSYKVFVGIVSDCFPIGGFRRRPYMLLGWSCCIAMLAYMGSLAMPAPYYGDPAMHFVDPRAWTAEQRRLVNRHAQDAAGQFVVPMMLAAFGYLVAEVAADAMVVELAQHEPLATRGQLQAGIHCARLGFNALGALCVAVAFNGAEYGGAFSFSLSFPTMMRLLAWASVPLLPVTWWLVDEPRVGAVERHGSLREYLRGLWRVVQQRCVYQVAAFKFFSGVCNNFNMVASSSIKAHWVHATPFNSSVMAVAGTLVSALTLAATGRYGLQWDWRASIAVTVVAGVAIDAVMTMCTTWDVVRNQWFWLGVPIVGYVPDGVRFIVSNFVVAELVSPGHEGAVYGLLTTTSNLAVPVGRTAAKLLNARFRVWVDDIMEDSAAVRRDVTLTIALCYGMKLVSLALLPLLPRQKRETQRLRREGGASAVAGALTVAYLGAALAWVTLLNLLSMGERTRCWAITGGCAPPRRAPLP